MERSDGIVGTWKLVSALLTTLGGESRNLQGENPDGLLTYTADGWMTAIIAASGRQPLSAADPVSALASERADAFATFVAYAVRYTCDGDRIIHHVEVSWYQNWVGTDQIRFAKQQGNRLTLTAPAILLRC